MSRSGSMSRGPAAFLQSELGRAMRRREALAQGGFSRRAASCAARYSSRSCSTSTSTSRSSAEPASVPSRRRSASRQSARIADIGRGIASIELRDIRGRPFVRHAMDLLGEFPLAAARHEDPHGNALDPRREIDEARVVGGDLALLLLECRQCLEVANQLVGCLAKRTTCLGHSCVPPSCRPDPGATVPPWRPRCRSAPAARRITRYWIYATFFGIQNGVFMQWSRGGRTVWYSRLSQSTAWRGHHPTPTLRPSASRTIPLATPEGRTCREVL